MSIALKLPNPQQHARLFLDDVVARYKARLMNAADYILNLVNIYRAKGQKLNLPSAKAFYEQFEIPKSTFYHALQRLKDTPDLGFNWEPTGGIAMWLEASEDVVAPSPVEKKEPKYANYRQLRDSDKALLNEFEIFVRNQWRKIKGQEIRSFSTFLEKASNFQYWWSEFQKHKATPEPVATAAESEPRSNRTFSPIPEDLKESLKGLFSKKST